MNTFTVSVIMIITMAVLLWLEYTLCTKTGDIRIRLLPAVYAVFWGVLALLCYTQRWFGGGWLNLSAFIAWILAVYGLWCLLSVGLGYILYKWKNRKTE